MTQKRDRDAGTGDAKGSPMIFGRSVNPIQTRGEIMPTALLLAPPIFRTFRHLCVREERRIAAARHGKARDRV